MQTVIASLFTLLYWLATRTFTVPGRPSATSGPPLREETQDTYGDTVSDGTISRLFSPLPKDELMDFQNSAAAEMGMLDERIFRYEEMVRNRVKRLHEIHSARNTSIDFSDSLRLMSRNLRDIDSKLSDLRERRELLQRFALDINVNAGPAQNDLASTDVCNVATNVAMPTTRSGEDETEGNICPEEHMSMTSSQPNGTRNANATHSLNGVATAYQTKPKLRPLRIVAMVKARGPQPKNKRLSLELPPRPVAPNSSPVTPAQTSPVVGLQARPTPIFDTDAQDLSHRLALLDNVLGQKKKADEECKNDDVQGGMEATSSVVTPSTPEQSAPPVIDNDTSATSTPDHTQKSSTVAATPESPSTSTHGDPATSDLPPDLSTDHLDDSDSSFDLSVGDDSVDSIVLGTPVKPFFVQSQSLIFRTLAKTRPTGLTFPNRFTSPDDLDLDFATIQEPSLPLAMKAGRAGKARLPLPAFVDGTAETEGAEIAI